ncbi:MAG TPA: Rho termination factor N-terminal domain-containing protein [Candidatus Binatia bacterium]
MDIKELRRLTIPKLRDFAKAETDLQGVGGMEKEELIKAIAKAKGIAYDESHKDVNAIHSIKHDIRELKKQKAEILTSSRDPKKLQRVQRKIKRLKRLTRHLAHEAKTTQAAKAAEPAPAAPAAAPAQPAPAQETPPAAG